MRKIITIIFIGILTLFSCGLSDKEKGKLKDATLLNIDQALQEMYDVKENMKYLKGRLDAANDKLEQLKGFKLLRSEDEREQQIMSQTIEIEDLKEQLSDYKQSEKTLEDKIDGLKKELAKYE